ncbi:MAG: YidC/Oxa1 family membrane protein insertase [Solirubrobacteraceae bacterium]
MFVLANILQPLIDLTEAIMKFFHDQVGFGWGASIIALTVVIRGAMLPLTLRQSKSMQSLQMLQPEIKALQAKYKGDKQRLNQEMMKFYQENKVNPLGSCLPLVLQLPFFLSLFYMLRKDLKIDICPGVEAYAHSINKSLSNVTCSQFFASPVGSDSPDKGDESFLFIPDLTAKATGAVLVTLIVLYVGSQLASSLLMTATADKNQRRLMLALPFVFVVFVINFPAGLLVYWITTNCWTILQQQIVRRTVGPIRPPAAAAAGATAGSDAPKSGISGLLGRVSGGPAGADAKANGAPATDPKAAGKASKAKAGDGNGKPEGPAAKPPPPPRRKKKRSGRRR